MTIRQIGRATMILGDCRDHREVLFGADVVLTDPPYGMNYRSGHNTASSDDRRKMLRKDGNFTPIAGDAQPFDPDVILSLDSPSIIWGANHFNERLPSGRRWLIWNKLCGKTPVPSGSDVELAWCSERGPDRIFDHLWRGIMRAGEENVAHSAKLHPNQKPVALMAWCLTFLPAGAVADPFMGSGSTGVAALRANRSFIGVELDPTYYEIACQRVDEAQRQGSMFGDAA
jgi:site-specific DNA-methyltransferase (adenine-specific)